jgi:tetratricopeptide (TPR) repeat protein
MDVLSLKEAMALLAELMGQDRLASERQYAEEIAERYGRLPLALRIVGAKLADRPHESLAGICERLQNERNLLDMMRYGDLEVRASFQLSYHDLDPEDQRGFRTLGLLRVGFPQWLVAALLGCDLGEAEALVGRLVDAQLLQIAGKDPARQTRYRFHDLLRIFAADLVTKDNVNQKRLALERGLTEYLALAQEAAVALEPGSLPLRRSRHERRWSAGDGYLTEVLRSDPVAWFTAERASLIAAVERAFETEFWELAWELSMTLPAFFELRADWDGWQRTHELASEAARLRRDVHQQAQTERSLGDLRREQGRFDQAIQHFDWCLPIFERLADRFGQAATLRSLGSIYRQQFRWKKAFEYFDRCRPIFEELGDRRGTALAEHDLGIALRNQGRWDDAIACFQRCLPVFSELKDHRSEAYALRSLGVAYRNQGRWIEAIAQFQKSLPIFERLGDRRGWAYALAPLSDVYRELGRYEDALKLLDECLLVRRELGDQRWEAATLRSIGVIYRQQGRLAAAITCFDECLIVFRKLRDERLAAYATVNLAEVYGDQGRQEVALTLLDESIPILIELQDSLWQAKARTSRGIVLASLGTGAYRQQAKEEWNRALEIFASLKAPEAGAVEVLLEKEVGVTSTAQERS